MGTSSQCSRVLDQVRRKRDGVGDHVMLQRQFVKQEIVTEQQQQFNVDKAKDEENQVQ